jgi:3-dehydrosphinganine reductase
LILGGVTSIPYFGWAISALPVLGICSLVPLYFLISKNDTLHQKKDDAPCNVIITGGSSGIGLAIAKACCLQKRVKSITIIARNETNLESAKQELLSTIIKGDTCTPDIQTVSANVTDFKSIRQAASSIPMQESTFLFCCAGVSHPGHFHDIAPQIFEDQIQLNYLGSVYTIKAILPLMKSGCMTLTSSAAGQVGVFGFTAYAPTKFALRGFAECLHMELSAQQLISIQLAFPPDTNTPGYQQEQQLKPRECHLISESTGLYESSEIATKMVQQAMKPNPPFTVWFGFEGWMLSALTAGMSPLSNLLEGVTQVTLMGLFRFISLFYLHNFWNIVKACKEEDETSISSCDTTAEDKKEQ